ncbi:non-canonical purine NTP diphosphatase [Viscerimonas tarda]
MMKELIFATNNGHKLEEVSAVLGEDYRVLSLKAIGLDVDIPEDGETLEANALIKARYIWEAKKCACFADDTGLEVESLGNAPGVHSARYAGEQKSAEDNVKKLLSELKGATNRKARFRTVIAAIIDGKEYLFEGVVNGEIIDTPQGNSGFGYDPVFVPERYNESFAELGNEQKNKISHRAKAVNKLAEFLRDEI